jgi:hypothetical protein
VISVRTEITKSTEIPVFLCNKYRDYGKGAHTLSHSHYYGRTRTRIGHESHSRAPPPTALSQGIARAAIDHVVVVEVCVRISDSRFCVRVPAFLLVTFQCYQKGPRLAMPVDQGC